MRRRKGVYAAELDAHYDRRRLEHKFGFQEASVNQHSEEIRERCDTKTKTKATKGVCVTSFEGVSDVVRGESEEQKKYDEEEEFGETNTVRQ